MNVQDLLKRHEGVRLKPYRDTVGKLTIGAGRNLDDVGLHPNEVDVLLQNDINIAWDACAIYPWFLSLSDARKAACIDLMFNMGPGKFRQFTKFISAMAANNWQDAGDELVDSLWYRQVGQRGVEVVNLLKFEVWPT